MDRGSLQKLKYMFFWTVGCAIIFIGAALTLSRQNGAILQAQAEETAAIYSEYRQGFENLTSYYEDIRNRIIYRTCGVGALLLVSFSCAVLFFADRERRNGERSERKNLEDLSERLALFQKGDYTVPERMFAWSHPGKDDDIWAEIGEDLRRLGLYFTSLREKLKEEENNTKSFITDISHQIKTPLASLKMNHELSRENALSPAERQECLQREYQEIQKLSVLIEELVKMSNLETHRIKIRKERIELRELIAETVDQVFMKAYAKNIRIQVEADRQIWVQADKKWTTEAFVNVLDNAVKYSGEGSVVTLRAVKLPSIALVEIEDEGIGIEREELHKIFQRFYRGAAASEYVKEGAGVGLYLTRKILEEQGGTITAKRRQAGTVFRITLPCAVYISGMQ